MKTTFRVHWLTVTIWGTYEYGYKMWEEWFSPYLGSMRQSGHGGRGFRQLSKAMLKASFYADPILQEAVDDQKYFSFDFPGNACDAIPDKVFQIFILVLDKWEKARITRLDLAWDEVGFTPETVREAVDKEQMRSYLRRKSMKYTISPYELREDGQLGTSSLRLGSNLSDRMLRIYDKRGPVRLELQSRKNRSDLLAREVLKNQPHEWDKPAISHLRDYVDFINVETKELLPWWQAFVQDTDRAMKTVSDAREIELNRMIEWISTQVSPALSVLADVIGKDSIDAFIIDGRRKRGTKYKALLEAKEKNHES